MGGGVNGLGGDYGGGSWFSVVGGGEVGGEEAGGDWGLGGV